MLGDIPFNGAELEAHIAKAEAEGKWLWCHYQDIWFSPAQLRAHIKNGQFRWGAVNWKLRDPQEYIEAANKRASLSKAEAARVAANVEANR